jgi:hypothetical protein
MLDVVAVNFSIPHVQMGAICRTPPLIRQGKATISGDIYRHRGYYFRTGAVLFSFQRPQAMRLVRYCVQLSVESSFSSALMHPKEKHCSKQHALEKNETCRRTFD